MVEGGGGKVVVLRAFQFFWMSIGVGLGSVWVFSRGGSLVRFTHQHGQARVDKGLHRSDLI